MKDFISLGEILIDMAPADAGAAPAGAGAALAGTENLYQPNPGGAPANVACVMGSLGNSAAFVGRVGDDVFGKLCVKALEGCSVDTQYVRFSEKHPTTLAVVGLDENGDRSFGFYRSNTADVTMGEAEIADIPFGDYKIFHFGSVSLSASPLRETTFAAVKKAKEQGCVISFDPNLRTFLWEDLDEGRKLMLEAMRYADIMKISEEEGEFLFGDSDEEVVFARTKDIPMVLYTKAEKGCVCAMQGERYRSRAFKIDVVDTTGAGDSFLGGLLHCLLELGGDPRAKMTPEQIKHMLDFANATGSLVTRAKGAIPAIPTLEEIQGSLKANVRILVD